MELKDIIYLVVLGCVIVCGIIGIVYAMVRGELKKFVVEKMEEAEFIYRDLPKPQKSKSKLEYVIKCVNDKYGVVKIFLNVKKFVEKIIEITKQINK